MKADRLARALVWALVLVLALLVLFVIVGHGEASSGLPPTITAAVKVTGVYCKGPCCCGDTTLVYHGHYYTRNLGYCRWFRPLREGEVVVTTLTLWR